MGNSITECLNCIGGAVKIGTLVEYYDYIKAVEYLICVGFLISFPIFYKKIIKYNGDTDKRHE
jgi:hypothetical protein